MYVLPYGQMSLWGLFEPQMILYDETSVMLILPLSYQKLRAVKRIGPHNFDILCILIGSLLGDSYAEKHGNGTRFCFQQEHSNNAYLLWFHSFISKLGYCNPRAATPKILTRLGKGGKIRQLSRFKTFTFTNFNWIQEAFYESGVKIVPPIVEKFLSPLALAVWIMDDGSIVSSGLKIATNSFNQAEVQMLCEILKRKFNLNASRISAGVPNQYNIYISKFSIKALTNIVGPHMHPSMYYKLNTHL